MSALRQTVQEPRVDALVRDIQEAIESGDRARQSQLVRRSADLLTKRWSRLPVEDKADYDILLAGLLSQVDEPARRAFAVRVAELRRAPPRTSALLAQDRSIRVAEPVLTQSRSFGDGWFQAVATACGDLHRAAIARRAGLGAPLCEALIRLGDAGVVAVLLANPSASISLESLPLLMRHARASEEVAVRLGARGDLPDFARVELAALALQRAEAALAGDVDIDSALAAALPGRIAALLAASVPDVRRARFDASMAGAGDLLAATVTPARLERWLELRRVEDVLAALAQGAGLEITPLVATFDAEDVAALSVVLRGLDYPWSTLKALLNARFRDAIPLDTLVASHRLMTDLGPGSARRLVRHAMALQGRTAYLAQLPG